MKKAIVFAALFLICLLLQAINLYSQVARFAVIGDYGSDHHISPGSLDSGAKKVSELVIGWQTDTNFFIITVGDNNYPNGDLDGMDQNIGQYYFAYIRPRNQYHSYGPGNPNVKHNRFFPAMGNHEFYNYTGGDPCQIKGCPYYLYFPIDSFKNVGPGAERYYDYLQGNIRFFVINSAKANDTCRECEPDELDSSSTQATWLKNGLDTSTARWNIVYFHHPPYFSTNQADFNDHIMMRWPFKRWGADIVLNGHRHAYERLNIDNFTYIINGLGGYSMEGLASPAPGSNVLSNGEVQYAANYGAMRVESFDDSLVFKFININNQLIDKYKLPTIALKLNILIEGFYDSSLDTLFRDTIRVHLRNSTTPYALVETAKGFLDTAGGSVLDFLVAQNSTNYYLVITHRNSIETWSANTISFNSYYQTYDFTADDSQALGGNMVIEDSKWCIFGGDINQDDVIEAADVALVDTDASNFVMGYVVTDVTGDSTVDAIDYSITDNNASNFVSTVTP